MQRWPWERIGRGELLLRCVCSAAREALGCQRREERGGAYRVATRTACYYYYCITSVFFRRSLHVRLGSVQVSWLPTKNHWRMLARNFFYRPVTLLVTQPTVFRSAETSVISRYADVSLVVIQQSWLSGLRRLIFIRRTWAKVPLSPVWVIRGVRKDIRSKRLTKRQWRAVVMYYVVNYVVKLLQSS